MTDPQDESASQGGPPTDDDMADVGPADDGDAVESGAILRSPAPAADSDPVEDPVRWPWEVGPNGEHPESQSKIPVGPTIRTEKLYRSSGYSDQTKGEDPLAETSANPVVAPKPDVSPQAPASSAEPVERINDMATAAPPAASGSIESPRQPERGLSSISVFFVIFGITTVVGLADMYVNRQFTYLTGGAFVIASAIGALLVRPRDLWTAVISPPIAFLFALIVAGQPTTFSGSGQLLLREASLIGTGLAFNAPYIFGGTILALIIVLIRRVSIRKN